MAVPAVWRSRVWFRDINRSLRQKKIAKNGKDTESYVQSSDVQIVVPAPPKSGSQPKFPEKSPILK
jgi:hypothetical protein